MPAHARSRGERGDREVRLSVDRAPRSGCCWKLFVLDAFVLAAANVPPSMGVREMSRVVLRCSGSRAACPVMTSGLRSPRRGGPCARGQHNGRVRHVARRGLATLTVVVVYVYVGL